eukprot:3873359-Amphidinium_carterae.2
MSKRSINVRSLGESPVRSHLSCGYGLPATEHQRKCGNGATCTASAANSLSCSICWIWIRQLPNCKTQHVDGPRRT